MIQEVGKGKDWGTWPVKVVSLAKELTFLPQSWEGRGGHTAFPTAQRASAKALRLTPSWPR